MPPKPNKYRRITNLDNSTTLPQRVTFPQGTFISNPSTAMDGQLGAPSGTLPARNLYAGSNDVYNMNAFLRNIPAQLHNAVQSYASPTPLTPYRTTQQQTQPAAPQSTYSARAGMPSQLAGPYNGAALSSQDAMQQYRTGEKGYVFDENNPIVNSVINRIASGEAADLTKQDAAALEKFLLKNGGGEGTVPGTGTATDTLGKGDFYGYERDPETGQSVRVVKNSATDNLRDELRWDEKRRKYIKVGKYMNQQKKLHMKKRYGGPGLAKPGGGGTQAAATAAAEESPNMGGGYGLVSFNTGLG